jgi:hypothetical protein
VQRVGVCSDIDFDRHGQQCFNQPLQNGHTN